MTVGCYIVGIWLVTGSFPFSLAFLLHAILLCLPNPGVPFFLSCSVSVSNCVHLFLTILVVVKHSGTFFLSTLVTQRSDWSETELREKTLIHTGVAYTAVLLSVHMRANEHTSTYTHTHTYTSTLTHWCTHIQYK